MPTAKKETKKKHLGFYKFSLLFSVCSDDSFALFGSSFFCWNTIELWDKNASRDDARSLSREDDLFFSLVVVVVFKKRDDEFFLEVFYYDYSQSRENDELFHFVFFFFFFFCILVFVSLWRTFTPHTQEKEEKSDLSRDQRERRTVGRTRRRQKTVPSPRRREQTLALGTEEVQTPAKRRVRGDVFVRYGCVREL